MTTPTITPAIRFRADAYRHTCRARGTHQIGAAVNEALLAESFPNGYSPARVAAAINVLACFSEAAQAANVLHDDNLDACIAAFVATPKF